MPEISIIVPVYQAERFLDRCVGSILSQSYQDYELILVNDGSRDRSGEICDAYEERFKELLTDLRGEYLAGNTVSVAGVLEELRN